MNRQRNNQLTNTVKFLVTASVTPLAPSGFSLIPPGAFTMGDALDDIEGKTEMRK